MTPLTPDVLRRSALPSHEAAGSKEGRGRVLVVGGCAEVPGAPLLAGIGALRAGAGKLQIATCRAVALPLGLLVPEAMVIGLDDEDGCIAASAAARVVEAARKVKAVVLGPGMSEGEGARAVVGAVLDGVDGAGLVLDAGAMAGLCDAPEQARRQRGRVVLTPHTGEMARLLGIERDAVEADKLSCARKVAAMLQAVVLMKGSQTEVVAPDGQAWLLQGGSVGLATSGSGDVLAGVIGGLLARGMAPVWAANWGAYLHAQAGRRLVRRDGGIGFLARELLDELPRVMAEACGASA